MKILSDGNISFKKGEYNRALEIYTQGLAKHPELSSILIGNIRLCEKRLKIASKKNVCVFAGFSSSNKIEDYVVHYLKKLKEITTYIVYVSDNYLEEAAVKRIDQIVDKVIASPHGEYDFGSYKRGLDHLIEKKIHGDYQLILCNDSCYGPVSGFKEIFDKMSARGDDFWGFTANDEIKTHIQSFFMVFNKKVVSSDKFRSFFYSVKKEEGVEQVIRNYEATLTEILANSGFSWSTFIDRGSLKLPSDATKISNLTVFPIPLLDAGFQLVKVKALHKPTTNLSGIFQTIDYLKETAPELYSNIESHSTIHRYITRPSPAISIILPTYNRANKVTHALNSVREQIKPGDELIVVDDGSTDETSQRVSSFAISSNNIKYVPQRSNQGVGAARNTGLKHAKNSWIMYLDSDNELKSYALQVIKGLIVECENQEIDCFYTRFEYASSGLRVGKEFSYENLTIANYIDMGVFVHRKKDIHHDEMLKRLVDWDYILSYTKTHKCKFFPITTLTYNDYNDGPRISNRESFDKALYQLRSKHALRQRVTTLVMCHNHERYLLEALDSALKQEGDFVHEIIFIDDASSDKSWDIFLGMSALNPKKIKGLKNTNNIGQGRSFREGLKLANGEFIAILEADDIWHNPRKIQAQLDFLNNNLSCGMVFSAIEVLDESKGEKRLLERQTKLTKSYLTAADFLDHPTMNLIGNLSSCVFRRSILEKLSENQSLTRITEMALAFHFDKYGPIGFISEPLSTYRQHPGGLWSGSDPRSQKGMKIVARKNLLKIADACWHPRILKAIEDILLE
jgi:glycosyltransferase involved in cell wall biosynthesis